MQWISSSILNLVGGIPTPLKNMEVNWDDEIPNIWKNKSHVPNHQPDNEQLCVAENTNPPRLTSNIFESFLDRVSCHSSTRPFVHSLDGQKQHHQVLSSRRDRQCSTSASLLRIACAPHNRHKNRHSEPSEPWRYRGHGRYPQQPRQFNIV